MKKRPMNIKAVIFRLEPTSALLAVSQYLISKDLRLGIISRSDIKTIRQDLGNCGFSGDDQMNVIISRPEIIQHKTDLELINDAAQQMNVAIENVLFISPHPFEVRAVQQIGAITAWMRAEKNAERAASPGDFEIEDVAEIKDVAEMGVPLPSGKLPNRLLHEFLNQFVFDDPPF